MMSPAEHRRAAEEHAGYSCPYCRFGIKQGVAIVICGRCGAVHHEDCWLEHGDCTADACVDRRGPAGPVDAGVGAGGASGSGGPVPVAAAHGAHGGAWGPPPVAASGGAGPRRWRVLALVLSVVLLAAGGAAVGLLLRDRATDGDQRAGVAAERPAAARHRRAPSAVATTTATGAAAPADVAEADPVVTTVTTETSPTSEPEVGAVAPSGSFYIAQIGSFRKRVNAEAEASRLQGLGFPAKVMDGADYEPLRDDYFAVYMGPYADQAVAEREARATRSAHTQGAFGRLVSAQ